MTDVRHGDDNILFDSDWSQPSFWALAHRVLLPPHDLCADRGGPLSWGAVRRHRPFVWETWKGGGRAAEAHLSGLMCLAVKDAAC